MTDLARIHGNDWSVLVPDPSATWTPHRTVSICIPTRNPGPGLAQTLRCLNEQTYPASLIEIVIADDGSDAPITVPEPLNHEVRVVRLERTLDFGAGRARNAAAAAARGEILLFLDADVIPERQVVESYARWFEACPLAVPMGLCRFVDVADLSAAELTSLIARGEMAAHYNGREVDDQSWREVHFRRFDDLRDEATAAFRVVIGATLAVAADQFHEVGGFPELGVRGVEDTALGYRLHASGAVLILDRDAVHWHQGRRTLSTARNKELMEQRLPFIQSVIPVRAFRPAGPPADPPVDVVPTARVHVRGDGPAADRTRQSIAGTASADVTVAGRNGFDPALVQVDLPAGVLWSSGTAAAITAFFDSHSEGVVKLVLPQPLGGIATIVRTRALQRARRVRPDDDPLDVAGELFGVWWDHPRTFGLVVPGAADTEPADAQGARRPRTARVLEAVHERVLDVLRRQAR